MSRGLSSGSERGLLLPIKINLTTSWAPLNRGCHTSPQRLRPLFGALLLPLRVCYQRCGLASPLSATTLPHPARGSGTRFDQESDCNWAPARTADLTAFSPFLRLGPAASGRLPPDLSASVTAGLSRRVEDTVGRTDLCELCIPPLPGP